MKYYQMHLVLCVLNVATLSGAIYFHSSLAIGLASFALGMSSQGAFRDFTEDV